MRRSIGIGIGVAAAAVLAAAGIASANVVPTVFTPAASDASAPASDASITRDRAEQIALALVPGGTVVETRLDNDGAQVVWNVHLRTASGTVEVKVDVQTGAARLDDNNNEADDDAAGDDDGRGHDDGDDDDDDDDHGGNRGPGGGDDDNSGSDSSGSGRH